MFRLIGIITVVAVVAIGYPALERWYAGEATPKETVKEVRESVGQKLITDDGDKSKSSSSGGKAAPAAAPKNETDAERVLREMSQKK